MNQPSTPIQKTFSFLLSPLSLLSILLLVLNDFILKVYWPSWFTGKLSNFCWLFFAPAIVFLFICFVLPGPTSRHSQTGYILVAALIGLSFGIFKVSASANQMILAGLSQIFRYHFFAIIDPTDLVALVSLPLSFVFWNKSMPKRILPVETSWAWMSLLVVLTMADSPMPLPDNTGITCLSGEGGAIISQSLDTIYSSQDGGMTWKVVGSSDDKEFLCRHDSVKKLNFHRDDHTFMYRSPSDQLIEESLDSGKTWHDLYDATNESEFRIKYFIKEWPSGYEYDPGPLDMYYDEASGNTIFAMGYEGVLVRKTDSSLVWVAIDEYKKLDLLNPHVFWVIMNSRLLSLILLVVLLFCSMGMNLIKYRLLHWMVYLGSVLWLTFYYTYLFESMISFVFIVYGLLVFSLALDIIKQSIRHFLWILANSLIPAVVLLLVNLGWYFGIVYHVFPSNQVSTLNQVVLYGSLAFAVGFFIWFSIRGRRYIKSNGFAPALSEPVEAENPVSTEEQKEL